jgi:hypothetical protein
VICHQYSSVDAGLQCSYPQRSECCADSYPGANDGYLRCCTHGVDCLDNLSPLNKALTCPSSCYQISSFSPGCVFDMSNDVLTPTCAE